MKSSWAPVIFDITVVSVNTPEEHEDGGWHQEDLVAGDELQDVLLVGRQFVQKVPDERQAVGAHGLKTQFALHTVLLYQTRTGSCFSIYRPEAHNPTFSKFTECIRVSEQQLVD